jgi:hypothetical protein
LCNEGTSYSRIAHRQSELLTIGSPFSIGDRDARLVMPSVLSGL